jgi:hypothetical protein
MLTSVEHLEWESSEAQRIEGSGIGNLESLWVRLQTVFARKGRFETAAEGSAGAGAGAGAAPHSLGRFELEERPVGAVSNLSKDEMSVCLVYRRPFVLARTITEKIYIYEEVTEWQGEDEAVRKKLKAPTKETR